MPDNATHWPRSVAAADIAIRTRRHIEAHYRDRGGCSTSTIARALGVSPSFLCHRSRAAFGTTIGRHTRGLRVAAACRLIEEHPTRLIKEIAAEVGYLRSSYRSFFNAFCAETGMSPRAYRRVALAGRQSRIVSA